MSNRVKVRLEFISVKPEILNESIDETTKQRSMRVLMKFQHGDVVNGNDREYSKELLQREITRLQEDLVGGAVFGASYHPKGADAEVNDVSHIWHKLWMEEDGSCMGEATILPTTNGKDAQIIIKAGGRIGVSSRGTGSVTKVQKDGKTIERVNSDYKMLSPGDLVLTPSVPGASVRAMIEKNANAYFSDEDETQISKSENSKDMEMIMEKFKEFETQEAYEAHLKEKQTEFLTSADFTKAVGKAVEAQKVEWTKEITAELEPKIEAVKKDQLAVVEAIREAVTKLTSINGVIPEEEKVEKEEKTDESLKTQITTLEQTIATMKQAQTDRDTVEKKSKAAKELQVALKTKLESELEKEEYKAYKPLIESELIADENINIESVEAVEEAVKKAHARLSEIKVLMQKQSIIESGIDERGIVGKDDEDTTLKEKAATLKARYNSSKNAGFGGNFEDWKKKFAK